MLLPRGLYCSLLLSLLVLVGRRDWKGKAACNNLARVCFDWHAEDRPLALFMYGCVCEHTEKYRSVGRRNIILHHP